MILLSMLLKNIIVIRTIKKLKYFKSYNNYSNIRILEYEQPTS